MSTEPIYEPRIAQTIALLPNGKSVKLRFHDSEALVARVNDVWRLSPTSGAAFVCVNGVRVYEPTVFTRDDVLTIGDVAFYLSDPKKRGSAPLPAVAIEPEKNEIEPRDLSAASKENVSAQEKKEDRRESQNQPAKREERRHYVVNFLQEGANAPQKSRGDLDFGEPLIFYDEPNQVEEQDRISPPKSSEHPVVNLVPGKDVEEQRVEPTLEEPSFHSYVEEFPPEPILEEASFQSDVEEFQPEPILEETPFHSDVEEFPPEPTLEETPFQPDVKEFQPEPILEETPFHSDVEEFPPEPTLGETSFQSNVEEFPSEPILEEASFQSDVEEFQSESIQEETPFQSDVEEFPPEPILENMPFQSNVEGYPPESILQDAPFQTGVTESYYEPEYPERSSEPTVSNQYSGQFDSYGQSFYTQPDARPEVLRPEQVASATPASSVLASDSVSPFLVDPEELMRFDEGTDAANFEKEGFFARYWKILAGTAVVVVAIILCPFGQKAVVRYRLESASRYMTQYIEGIDHDEKNAVWLGRAVENLDRLENAKLTPRQASQVAELRATLDELFSHVRDDLIVFCDSYDPNRLKLAQDALDEFQTVCPQRVGASPFRQLRRLSDLCQIMDRPYLQRDYMNEIALASLDEQALREIYFNCLKRLDRAFDVLDDDFDEASDAILNELTNVAALETWEKILVTSALLSNSKFHPTPEELNESLRNAPPQDAAITFDDLTEIYFGDWKRFRDDLEKSDSLGKVAESFAETEAQCSRIRTWIEQARERRERMDYVLAEL